MMSTTNNNTVPQHHQQQQHNNNIVIPGQLIAVSTIRGRNNNDGSISQDDVNSDDGFLRGHGTYVETINGEYRLYASTVGIVQRINKLISIQPISATTFYRGQVGDLVVGRIIAVTNGKWKIDLGSGRSAILPLQGVHLPGGIQRIRTSEDILEMRQYLSENDLVSAEVHKVVSTGGGSSSSTASTTTGPSSSISSSSTLTGVGDGSGILRLHTRSIKYGKLENGCYIQVPSSLIQRRKNHYTNIINNQFQILLGCNGMIWIQRNSSYVLSSQNQQPNPSGTPNKHQHVQSDDLVELHEQRRIEHNTMPYSKQQRNNLARIRNSIECLRRVHRTITTERIEAIYTLSEQLYPSSSSIFDMLQPNNLLQLIELTK